MCHGPIHQLGSTSGYTACPSAKIYMQNIKSKNVIKSRSKKTEKKKGTTV
jgi:hypothetical protein